MAAIARPHHDRLGSTATRLLILAGVLVGFWLLLLLFGGASAKADSGDVPAPKAARASATHLTADLAATVTRTTDHAVRTVTEQTERLTRLSKPPVRAVVSRLAETTERVRQADAMVSSLVIKPVRAVVDAVRKPVRAIVRVTDTHVSVNSLPRVVAPATGAGAVRPALGSSIEAGPATAADATLSTTGSGEHHIAKHAAAVRADHSAHPALPSPVAPVPTPIGDGNAPGVNRGGTHDVPAVPAPSQSAAHRDRMLLAPPASTLPFDGTPAPRPGFSPD